MAVETLTNGTLTVPYMPMTVQALECLPPILEDDFDNCRIPGGVDLWSSGGFYSPGQCFVGYKAQCTQTRMRDDAWPISEGETAVRCIPSGYDCNDVDGNPRFATTEYDGTTLSAPAFEIRWRSEDLKTDVGELPAPSMTLSTSYKSSPATPLATSIFVSGTSGPSPTNSNGPSTEDQSSNSSLTTGSIAGIAVGASLGTLGMTLSFFYLAIRRRRRKSGGSQGSTRDSFDQSCHLSPVGPAVVEGQPPVEMAQRPEPRELDSSAIFYDEKGTRHVSLNSVPVEMAAEPVKKDGKIDEE